MRVLQFEIVMASGNDSVSNIWHQVFLLSFHDIFSFSSLSQVYCFLTFNVGDLVGRSIVGKYQFVGPDKLIWPVLARLLFIPVFMLCNITPTYLAVVFKSDFWPFFFMFLMAVSNGSLGSLCMMYGPGLVNQKDKETAGTLMVLYLVVHFYFYFLKRML